MPNVREMNAADKADSKAGNDRLYNNFGKQTIANDAAYVASLSQEARWALIGRTYDEEQQFRAEHDQNPDGTAKYTNENVIGGIITGALIAVGVAVTGGLILDAVAGGGVASAGAMTEAITTVTPEAAGIIAPVSAAVAPVAIPTATTIATATGAAATVGKVISDASDSAVEVIKQSDNMNLLEQGLNLLQNPSVGALTNALTGSNSKSASLLAAQQSQIFDKLNEVADATLSAAQKAALGNTNTNSNAGGTPAPQTIFGLVWYIPVIIVTIIVGIIIWAFTRKKKK